MIALFDFLGTLVKRTLIAVFLLGGLLIGLLIAIKVLIVIALVRLYRSLRGPSRKPAVGNVFEAEYTVVNPVDRRATLLMVPPSKSAAPGAPLI